MAPAPIKVLVFPAGETNSVEIFEALSRQVNIELYGASSVERVGRHLFRRYRSDLPPITDPGFIAAFNSLLADWTIDVVIPTHDSVVEFLAVHEDEVAAQLLTPDAETALVCRDKRLTYELFADCSFTPRQYESAEAIDVPVFVKPTRGQGGYGARLIKPGDAAISAVDWATEVVCEFLPGEELTVDCLTDRHGELLGVFPRSRDRTLGGVSVSGRALKADDDLRAMAETINDRLDFLGMWYFQVRQDVDGRFKLLEISARCSGSQVLTRARGVNLPLLSVYAAMGRDIMVRENHFPVTMDRTLMSMFDFGYDYAKVYLDYDDTVINLRGVDPDILRLIYQFRNDGKTIILITRHDGDIHRSLRKHCIDPHLFAEIVHLQKGELKADHMQPDGAIFIDNMFAERLAVQERHGIPVFDVDTTMVLQKWSR